MRNFFETKAADICTNLQNQSWKGVDFMNGEQNIRLFNSEHFVLA